MVWETRMALLGIPITKGLPFGIFMKQIIFEMTLNGQMNRLIKKWKMPKPDCKPIHREGEPLSLEKMISLFIISMMGIFIAITIIIIEKIFHAYKPRNHVFNGVFIKNQKSKIPRPIKSPKITICH